MEHLLATCNLVEVRFQVQVRQELEDARRQIEIWALEVHLRPCVEGQVAYRHKLKLWTACDRQSVVVSVTVLLADHDSRVEDIVTLPLGISALFP